MRLSSNRAKELIREVVSNSDRVFFSTHVKERMAERLINRRQILTCLQKGIFVEEPAWSQLHGNYTFSVESVAAGDVVTVAAALCLDEDDNYIIVITVY